MTDKVNHPVHYTEFPLEVIDIIEIVLIKAYGEKAFEAYCFGNEIKYRMRAGLKGESADEDIRKANKYKEFRETRLEDDGGCVIVDESCFVESDQDPDNEEWESSGDVMGEQEATKCEICGNYRTDIHPYKGFLTCERCIRLDCGVSKPYEEISPGIYDGEKDVMDEKAKQGAVEGRKGAEKCKKCHGIGQTFMPETDSWITCRVCDGVGYV